MATDKQKKALRPIQPIASEGTYEAFVAGSGSNREYNYQSGKGFVATNDPEASPNVFSTFAMLQDGTITTQELIKDRIENADKYVEQAQRIAAVVSNTMPRYFNKSSYIGSIRDVAAFALEGAEKTVQSTYAAGANLPDTWKNIKSNEGAAISYFYLNASEKKNIDSALSKEYKKFLANEGLPEGSPETSQEQAMNLLSWVNPDNMTGENGQPLTDREKDTVKAIQQAIVSDEQIKRNRMADVWFSQMLEENIANSWLNPNMGSKTLRAIGNAAGNILVSGMVFGAAGATPELIGMRAATAAAGAGAYQTAKGLQLINKAARMKGIAQKYAALDKYSKAYKWSGYARTAERLGNYQKGVGAFVTNNFEKMVALSSIMGRGAVFSQSFLTEFTDVRNNLIAQGANSETATSAALAAGFGEASIETLVGFRFLNKFLTEQRSFKNFLFRAVIPEGLEEASQTLSENVITKAVGFNDATYSDIAAEMVFSFIGGALGGAAFGAGAYKGLSRSETYNRVMDYELAKRQAPELQQSELRKYGELREAIRQKYTEDSKKSRLAFEEKKKQQRKAIEEEFEKLKTSNPDWQAQAESRYILWEQEATTKWQEEEAGRQKRLRDDLHAAHANQFQQERLQDEAEFEQNKYGSSDESIQINQFTSLEMDLLEKMRTEYEERARTVNPDITLEQLDNGWKGVKALLTHEGYTGQFTNAISNAIDNMISFSSASDQQVKDALNSLIKTLGLTPEESDVATRLTSKDAVEKYNAELDYMEEAIVRDFEAAGAKAEGKVFAKIFRNQLGTLPLFAKDANGNSMTPVSFYNAVKPRIINIQNAMMHNQEIMNIDNMMYEATRQFDRDENYKTGSRWQYRKAYDKYQNILGLISSYKLADEQNKKVIMANINLALFNSYNYTKDIDSIEKYLQLRQEKEYAVVHELGMDAGKRLSNEDYMILALMRQKGLSFAFAAKSIGLANTSIKNDNLNTKYESKVQELFPAPTESDLNWINKIAGAEGIGKAPAGRNYYIDTEDKWRTTYVEETEEEEAMREQAEKDILEEEGELFTEQPEDKSSKVKISKSNVSAANSAPETYGISTKFIEPNALYAREGKVILVVNGKNQGEFLHEAGHYMITEFLLQNMELGSLVGDRALGPVNQLLIALYNSVKGNSKVRLNQVQKQETILDALMDFIRNDGHTGNQEVDEIISELQGMLNEEIMHPDQSKYDRLPDAQKKALRENIRNLFSPTVSIDMLNDKIALEKAINNMDIESAAAEGLKYLEKYAVPDMDLVRAQLENKDAGYIEKRAALEQLKTEINMQAIAQMLNNTEELAMAHKQQLSKSESENIGEDAIFLFAQQQKAEQKSKAAREPMTPKERGIQDFKLASKTARTLAEAGKQIYRSFTTSLVEQGRRLHPEIGAAIQRVMYENGKLKSAGLKHAKAFIDAFNEYKKIDTITQEEYDENFVDNLNNFKVSEAKEWLLNRVKDDKIRAELKKSFEGMINWMAGAKDLMMKLEVRPEASWMEDGTYFPRSVNDYEDFSDYLNLAPKNIFDKIVSDSGVTVAETAKEERNANYNLQRMFASLARSGEHEQRVKFLQNRVIQEVTPEMRQYYKDPIDAYIDYVEDVALTVMTRQLIGAQRLNFEADEDGSMRTLLSAGAIFHALDKNGFIYKGRIDTTGMTDEQIQQVKEDEAKKREFMESLRAFLNRHKETNPLFKYTNDFLTVTMLGHFATALSQGQEMITTATLFGLTNTAKAAMDVAKGKGILTIEDLNIEELEDAYKPLTSDTMAVVTNGVLKYTGFKAADVYFKNVAINAIYNYFENALRNRDSKEYQEAVKMIETSFGTSKNYDARVETLIDDIQNRKISDDIKFLMYDVFANQQPINAANISWGYNSVSPLGRLCLYKFNTVAYKQLNAMVNHFKKSFTGENGKVDFGKGLIQVLRLMMFCAMIGIPLETIKNILNGRLEFNPKKDFIFSFSQCFLLNEYDAQIMGREGVGSLVQNKFAAPLTPFNWYTQDVRDLFDGKFSGKFLKGIPGGRPIHNFLYAIANTPNTGKGYDFDIIDAITDFGEDLV